MSAYKDNDCSMTLCPLYDTLGDEAVLHMLLTTQMSCVAGAEPNLIQILKLLQRFEKREDKLRSMICFDDPSDEIIGLARSVDVTVS